MIENANRLKAVGAGTDPATTLSYGILLDYLTKMTSHKYEWNLLVQEHMYGPPKMHQHYIDWASGKNIYERDSRFTPILLDKIKPEFFLTLGDVQYIKNIRMFIPKTVPWVHWLPIDSHDDNTLFRNKYTLDGVDVLVPMSKHGYYMAKRNRLKPSNYIYPFINSKEYSVITEPKLVTDLNLLKKELKVENKKVLLWVGRPGWRKNLEMLLGAYSKLLFERERDDIHLYLHTNVNDESATFNMGKLIHALGLDHKDFTITNRMALGAGAPMFYLRGLYNMAYLYVSTHGGEGFGMPIAESMACETPFVCTNCTTTEELSGNGERGLGARIAENHIDQGIIRPFVDMEDFCDKIEFILDNEEKRDKMGKKGREWVLKNCSVEVIGNKWLKLLSSLSANKVKIRGVINE